MHSHAYRTNKTYAGACVDEKKFKKKKDRLKTRKELVKALGLEHELKFACPSDEDLKAGRAKILTRKQFRGALFPQEWFRHLQSKTTFPYKKKDPSKPLQVVVHVRRGDFTPCHVSDRYLPNTYYLEALDRYVPEYCDKHEHGCNVTIYTERNSFEPVQPFVERNYTVDFDSSLSDIWSAFVNADVMIMSMSSFSFVPASLNRNTVITAYYDIVPWRQIHGSIWSHAMMVRRKQIKECQN